MKQFWVIAVLFLISSISFGQSNTVVENLGSGVNSGYGEGNPTITPDGKLIYFSVWRHPSNFGPDHDTWYSYWDSTHQKFSTRIHPSAPLNKEGKNNSVECTNPDGTIVYIRGSYVGGMYITKGFSYTKKVATGYAIPQRLNIKEFSSMAQGQYTNMCISTDGQVMFLSFSEKPESYQSDIYVSFKEAENVWSKPLYITALNNKKLDESTPFLAADGKTLYFSSDRPGTLGSNDIWMTKRLDDTWMNWSPPVNLGPEINTPNWDAYYKLSAKGDYAYMTSEVANGFGGSDIVRIRISKEIQPEPVVLIRGKVLDKKTGKPMSADIVYSEFGSNKIIGQTISDPVTGMYTIILPYGKKYDYRANAKGYFPEANEMDLSQVSSYKEIQQDLFLSPVETGQTVRLNNVLFILAKAEIIPESNAELNRVVELLKANPSIVIRLEGHTDDQGNDDFNLTLSQTRVEAIRNYLIQQGIASERIQTIGYGESKPLAPNNSEANRQLNRRVEFVILKM